MATSSPISTEPSTSRDPHRITPQPSFSAIAPRTFPASSAASAVKSAAEAKTDDETQQRIQQLEQAVNNALIQQLQQLQSHPNMATSDLATLLNALSAGNNLNSNDLQRVSRLLYYVKMFFLENFFNKKI